MPDTYPNLKADPIEDVRADIDNIPRDNDSNGLTYYVDGNAGSNGYDGLSWWTEPGTLKGPKATLAAAIAASNLTIATHPILAGAGWAARNIINIKGDMLVEDLTVLAQKCDIIGRGSHDANPMATIQGNHAIGAAGNHGCRWFNVRFTVPAAGGDIFTVPTTTGGLAFKGCVFNAHQSTKAGGALIVTASLAFKVLGCRFIGAFSDAVIELGTGAMADLLIADNIIEGANKGIEVNSGLTIGQWQGYILRNRIYTQDMCIDENSDTLVIGGNRGITANNKGALLVGAIDGNVDLAFDNRFTCADENNVEWPALGAI